VTPVDETRELTRIKLGFFRQRNGHCANAPTCGGWAAHEWHPKAKGLPAAMVRVTRGCRRAPPIGLDGVAPVLLLIQMPRVRACTCGSESLSRMG